jgi:tetratricopeptide (TPR) repeat protein
MKRLVLIVLLSCVAARAHAQPWAQGVTDAQKTEAQARLEEGNALFLKQSYKEALDKYQQALRSWDHPSIRFNIVRCLIQLDRNVDAFDNLKEALRYGAEPLEENVYREALAYEKLLANEVAEVEISCTQQGVVVLLDGKDLVACPGRTMRRVAPGKHGVVANKEGFLTVHRELKVLGGSRESIDIKLLPLAQATQVVHRWPQWIPWVVFGGGLAVTSLGGFIEYNAQRTMAEHDREVARDCAVGSCFNDPDAEGLTEAQRAKALDLQAQRSSASLQDKIAIGVITVGAAAAIAGGAMLVLNRGETIYSVEPQAGGGMITATGRF